jgi:enamine deaminase RidA (YjgF/YER057c/UK114 family)/aromatic ring-opening dioxygenase catalytic subunit (LigB family)
MSSKSVIEKAFIVSGLPHIYLAPEKSKGWQSLHSNYAKVKKEIDEINPDLILYYSTGWLSVLGYMFQGREKPKWMHVDSNWHELGEIGYEFEVDTEFPKLYADEVKQFGHNTRVVDYEGFPIDTGTIVAQKFLNPDNKYKAAMVSCNMYSEKEENIKLGQAAARALSKHGKKAVAVLVSNLSNRFEIHDIDPAKDKISSLKDDEWNQKVLEMLSQGDLEDVSQTAREFSRQANADMGFRGIWWLNGLCGENNDFKGKVYDYQPVWGSGAALVSLSPEEPILARSIEDCMSQEEASQAGLVDGIADTKPSLTTDSSSALKPNSILKTESTKDKKTSSLSIKNTHIQSSGAPEPVGAYPHARVEGDFIFLSGVGPRKKGTKVIPGVVLDKKGNIESYDVEVQTQSVIDNVKMIIEDAGGSIEDVVDIQVFLTNMKDDFQIFNKVYADTFKDIGATRTTIEVLSLPTPIAVEFKVVAKRR